MRPSAEPEQSPVMIVDAAVGRKRKRSAGALALALVALAFAAVQLCASDGAGCLGGPRRRQLEEGGIVPQTHHMHHNFTVCGRATDIVEPSDYIAASRELQQQYASCPTYTPGTPIVYLSGHQTFGRTANHLIALQMAFQYARDTNAELAIARDSWATDVLLKFFMAGEREGEWEANVARELCIKVVNSPDELEGREVAETSNLDMFLYHSRAPREEAVAGQLHALRTLFRFHNTGGAVDHRGAVSRDVCSGIDSLFGVQDRNSAVYSVIHLRYLEGKPGISILSEVSKLTGCDPRAALDMRPEYVKSILQPLGMLEHPIVVITDGQSRFFLHRLRMDKDVGPMLQVLPESASWAGGDIMLGAMSTVFIGNPASTFSGFIARSRVALGLGHSYLFRAKDGNGGWKTTCGELECLFRKGRPPTPDELRQKQGIVHDVREHAARMDAKRTKNLKWLEGRG